MEEAVRRKTTSHKFRGGRRAGPKSLMADHKVPPSLVLGATPPDTGRGLLACLLGMEAMDRTGLPARRPDGT